MEIKIRTAAAEDAEALLAIYAPYVADTAITFEYEIPSVEEFRRRITNTLSMRPYLVAYCLDAAGNEDIVGYAYTSAFKERAAYDWAEETSIYVRMDVRGSGAGRALYEALEAVSRKRGIINLNACIAAVEVEDEHLTNDSVFFHEHLGYKMVGKFHLCGYKFGRWYDMVWMEKMLGEHPADPGQVRPFPEIGYDTH